MTADETRARFEREPRFHGLVIYLSEVVTSGSFSGEELAAAAALAGILAEEHRVSTPSRHVEHAGRGPRPEGGVR
jgi:hypothetical protein